MRFQCQPLKGHVWRWKTLNETCHMLLRNALDQNIYILFIYSFQSRTVTLIRLFWSVGWFVGPSALLFFHSRTISFHLIFTRFGTDHALAQLKNFRENEVPKSIHLSITPSFATPKILKLGVFIRFSSNFAQTLLIPTST